MKKSKSEIPKIVEWYKTATWGQRWNFTRKLLVDGIIIHSPTIAKLFFFLALVLALIDVIRTFNNLAFTDPGVALLGQLAVTYILVQTISRWW